MTVTDTRRVSPFVSVCVSVSSVNFTVNTSCSAATRQVAMVTPVGGGWNGSPGLGLIPLTQLAGLATHLDLQRSNPRLPTTELSVGSPAAGLMGDKRTPNTLGYTRHTHTHTLNRPGKTQRSEERHNLSTHTFKK